MKKYLKLCHKLKKRELLPVPEMIRKLSAGNMYEGNAALIVLKLFSLQPCRLIFLLLVFLISMNSALGKLIAGVGSARISSIIISNR